MKPFSTLRNGRLRLDFKEIAVKQSRLVAAIAGHEASTSAFLSAVVTTPEFDPLTLTVSERNMAICHYIMHVTDDDPNFRVGKGRLFDYMAFDKTYADPPKETAQIAENIWRSVHLTGAFAESIERLQGAFEVGDGVHWQAGMMAAQLRNQDDPDSAPDNIDNWMGERMVLFLDMPESEYFSLLAFLESCNEKMMHLFSIVPNVFNGGFCCNPMAKEGEGSLLPPATFPPASALHQRTQALLRVTGDFGRAGGNNLPS